MIFLISRVLRNAADEGTNVPTSESLGTFYQSVTRELLQQED